MTEITPDRIAPPAANYAHAVLTSEPARWLHTSGVVPTASDGSTPPTIGEQAVVVWDNLAAILEAADMDASDIVSVTTFAVKGHDLGPVMAARDRALGGHRAASTLVPVPALAQPQWLVEVAVIAASSRP